MACSLQLQQHLLFLLPLQIIDRSTHMSDTHNIFKYNNRLHIQRQKQQQTAAEVKQKYIVRQNNKYKYQYQYQLDSEQENEYKKQSMRKLSKYSKKTGTYTERDQNINDKNYKDKSTTDRSYTMENKQKQSPSMGIFGHKINKLFKISEVTNATDQQLSTQIKAIRQMLLELNRILSEKLDKYEQVELSTRQPTKNHLKSNEKAEILSLSIQRNYKMLDLMEEQLRQLKRKEKQLSSKDYFIQLQQYTNQYLRQISIKTKEKIQKQSILSRANSRAYQTEDLHNEQNYRAIKTVKHNILHYYKKFHQNKSILQQLQTSYAQLIEKDKLLANKVKKLGQLAVQLNLEVGLNGNYLENKKMQQQLVEKVNNQKKKISIFKKLNSNSCQLTQTEITKIRKQITALQTRIEQVQKSNNKKSQQIQQILQNNASIRYILNKFTKKFSKNKFIQLSESKVRNVLKKDSVLSPVGKKRVYTKPAKQVQQHYIRLQLERNTKTPGRYRTENDEPQQKQQNAKINPQLSFQAVKSNQFRVRLNKKKSKDVLNHQNLTSLEKQLNSDSHPAPKQNQQ